jgi:molybdopterin synthase catalytic subunit/molybdopterin converting factor small subunit
MRIGVRLFARQREIAGESHLDLEVSDGGSVEQAWQALVSIHPALASTKKYVRFARNGTYATLDEALIDGDEVACIPLLSGRDDGEDGALVRNLVISPDPIDTETLRSFEAAVATPVDGAVVLFVGRTRETPRAHAPGEDEEAERHAGHRVVEIDYEVDEAMAARIVEEIAGEIETRFGVRRLAVVHRVGTVPLGDATVAIAVASPHRSEAFDACRYAVGEFKARTPIRKSERFDDGSVRVVEPAQVASEETTR